MGTSAITFQEIKSKRPDLDDDFINMHIRCLDDPYFQYYSDIDVICSHIESIQKLTSESPVGISCFFGEGGKLSCTIVSFNYQSEFSLITGILAAMDIQVSSGVVFTYETYQDAKLKKLPTGKTAQSAEHLNLYRRKIIDRFEGYVVTALPPSLWLDELYRVFHRVFSLLEKNDGEYTLEAKTLVNELVVKKLADRNMSEHEKMYPVDIRIVNDAEKYTTVRILSVDTPFFLYSISTALSLRNILIEYVNIKTSGSEIEDEFHVVDARSTPIIDSDKIDMLKFTVLLSKQFSYFLGSSPDPFKALSRFELLVEDTMKLPEQGQWKDLLSDPNIMSSLARILGMSDQLWEDFIRLQYETIIPLLRKRGELIQIPTHNDSIESWLHENLASCQMKEEFVLALNQIKDREIFLLDLEYIVNSGSDFRVFSERLTRLAEVVIKEALERCYTDLQRLYGTPRSIAGLPTKYAILALGKFGGVALGYASDIELLLVFSDNGKTDGAASIDNAEFFDHLVQEMIATVKSKREGIFRIDVRLRPYGNKGPLAISLDSFTRYYGPGGDAYSYERLALVRMRPIAGNSEFGEMLSRLRDECIYLMDTIDQSEIFSLRKRQYREKIPGQRINAKFSPGALVDLEYAVQLLQVLHGKRYPSLRTPRIHAALDELKQHNILDETECNHLVAGYNFMRKLINGLRMLRGSANDLLLPEQHSLEFAHLARRMGYTMRAGLTPEQQLYIDFENYTARIRLFVERYFGRQSLPASTNTVSIADLVLSPDIGNDEKREILTRYGFKNTDRAASNFLRMTGLSDDPNQFSMLAVLACDMLRNKPDPDMALNNWERFITILDDPVGHYRTMLSQPAELDLLLSIFSESQFLSDILIRNPQLLEWVIVPENLYKRLTQEDLLGELRSRSQLARSNGEWLDALRIIRKREFLRIGACDICLGMSLQEITNELSVCAESFIRAVMERTWTNLPGSRDTTIDIGRHFCIMALGKLGGAELNYSSDIDLVGIFRIEEGSGPSADDPETISLFNELMKQLRHDLAAHTEEGHAYRVDFRLRPFGLSGRLIGSYSAFEEYYGEKAELWEVQALIKARPVAGNLEMGSELVQNILPRAINRFDRKAIVSSIKDLRAKAVAHKSRNLDGAIDIKDGEGGIRDIEFLVQGLQMIHAPGNAGILHPSTLRSIELLQSRGLLPKRIGKILEEEYIFLRRVEHFLQLFEDRQVHCIPETNDQLMFLARRFMGKNASISGIREMIVASTRRVRDAYNQYLA